MAKGQRSCLWGGEQEGREELGTGQRESFLASWYKLAVELLLLSRKVSPGRGLMQGTGAGASREQEGPIWRVAAASAGSTQDVVPGAPGYRTDRMLLVSALQEAGEGDPAGEG